MSNFPSLTDNAHLRDVFKRFPKGAKPLLALHDALLREPGEIPIGQRELIAAYGSGLNKCRFCFGAHKVMATVFGIDPELFDALFEDIDTAPVEPGLRALLKFVGKRTIDPSKVSSKDSREVLAAGWSEEALYDAIAICSLYCFMNRIVEGAGIEPRPEYMAPDKDALKQRHEGTYSEWGRREGLLTE